MLLISIILVSLYVGSSYGVLYDVYTGEPVENCLLKFYEKKNLTDTCVIDVKPCDPNEWRRVDGTCNNLKHPAMGNFFGPLKRILPAQYHNGNKPRRAVCGEELPLARVTRVHLLGQTLHQHHLFNHNVPDYAAYKFTDIGSFHDSENMLFTTNYCCKKEHMNDEKCTPNIIPDDDPTFRYSSIRCLNSTRPLTYQDFGCTRDSVPSVIKKATAMFDESQIYNTYGKGDKVVRSFKNGKLIVEEEDGKLFPPNGPTAICPNNHGPNETRCFENHFNALLSTTLYVIWFVRHHNYVCDQLVKVNPCWDDDRLFYTARDINIAISNEMYFSEWFEALQGRKNLIKAGIITEKIGFRDLYDETQDPEVTLEHTYVNRFFHLLQEERAKMYDKEGNYVYDFPLFNTTYKMGFIAKNMESFTKDSLSACHAFDGTVTYDAANRGLPWVQEASDIAAGDLNKGRNFGLPPFVDYVHHFTGVNITNFEELEHFIPKHNIEKLQCIYKHVRNVDLMAGMWVSKPMKGGNIPELMAYILNDSWYRVMKSDRHNHLRKDRPHAFTLRQLTEIVKKGTLASLLCTVGDGVHEIPRKAFFKISKKNPLVSCSRIPKIDYRAWADDACKDKKKRKYGKKNY